MTLQQAALLSLGIGICTTSYYCVALRGKDALDRSILGITCSTVMLSSVMALILAAALF